MGLPKFILKFLFLASQIANMIVTNMKTRAQEYSLDDIERLAKSWNEVK